MLEYCRGNRRRKHASKPCLNIIRSTPKPVLQSSCQLFDCRTDAWMELYVIHTGYLQQRTRYLRRVQVWAMESLKSLLKELTTVPWKIRRCRAMESWPTTRCWQWVFSWACFAAWGWCGWCYRSHVHVETTVRANPRRRGNLFFEVSYFLIWTPTCLGPMQNLFCLCWPTTWNCFQDLEKGTAYSISA